MFRLFRIFFRLFFSISTKRRAGEKYLWLNLNESASIARLVNECPEAPNLELLAWPPESHDPDPQTSAGRRAARGPPSARRLSAQPGIGQRLYLVAKHDVPALQELYWERVTHKRGPGGRPAKQLAASDADAQAAGRGASTADAAEQYPALKRRDPGAALCMGSYVEVRSEEPGMLGSRYGALVLSRQRYDGMIEIEYTGLYESEHAMHLQVEWIQQKDPDHVRPVPPSTPDGWHGTLQVGDELELSFEAGWWPVKVVRLVESEDGAPRTFAVISSKDEQSFKGLTCVAPATHLRPAWRWLGKRGDAGWSGGWRFVTLAAGAVETDDRGRPVKKQSASEPAAAPAAVSIEAAKEADIAKRVAAIAASTAYRAIGREDLAEAIAPGDFKPSIAPASTQQAAAADSSGAADPAASSDAAASTDPAPLAGREDSDPQTATGDDGLSVKQDAADDLMDVEGSPPKGIQKGSPQVDLTNVADAHSETVRSESAHAEASPQIDHTDAGSGYGDGEAPSVREDAQGDDSEAAPAQAETMDIDDQTSRMEEMDPEMETASQ